MCGLNDASERRLVAFSVCVGSVMWSVEVVDGCVRRCVNVMLLRKCAAAILGVAVPIVCDAEDGVVVHGVVS